MNKQLKWFLIFAGMILLAVSIDLFGGQPLPTSLAVLGGGLQGAGMIGLIVLLLHGATDELSD